MRHEAEAIAPGWSGANEPARRRRRILYRRARMEQHERDAGRLGGEMQSLAVMETQLRGKHGDDGGGHA